MTTLGLIRSLIHSRFLGCNPLQMQSTPRGPSVALGLFFNHEQTREMSRVKRRFTHPPYWHPYKNQQKEDTVLSPDNKTFIKEVIDEKYRNTVSPLKGGELVKTEWSPTTKRSGLIARNIGKYPLWEKDGTKVLCTLLHVLDNHVIRYIPPEEYGKTMIGQKFFRNRNPLACLVVGAEATNPVKFTKMYCNLFAEAGVMPKKRLARFIVTPDAALPPGTPLSAGHFVVGQAVDVYGKTIDYGFQGVVKRWGMKGGPASHGATKFHRRVGSIGSGRDKARVWPGKKMPGHMGSERRFARGIEIMRINMKYNVIYVKGPVPGGTNSIVQIFDTILPLRRPKEPLPHPTYFPPKDGSEEDVNHPSLHVYGSPSISI